MFAACACKLEEILKEGDKFVFAFAVGQKQWEKDGEVARSNEDFFGDLFRKIFSVDCILGQIMEWRTSQWHPFVINEIDNLIKADFFLSQINRNKRGEKHILQKHINDRWSGDWHMACDRYCLWCSEYSQTLCRFQFDYFWLCVPCYEEQLFYSFLFFSIYLWVSIF
jgi:hypothetical protein